MIAVGRHGKKEDLPDYQQEREFPSSRKSFAEIAMEGIFKQGRPPALLSTIAKIISNDVCHKPGLFHGNQMTGAFNHSIAALRKERGDFFEVDKGPVLTCFAFQNQDGAGGLRRFRPGIMLQAPHEEGGFSLGRTGQLKAAAIRRHHAVLHVKCHHFLIPVLEKAPGLDIGEGLFAAGPVIQPLDGSRRQGVLLHRYFRLVEILRQKNRFNEDHAPGVHIEQGIRQDEDGGAHGMADQEGVFQREGAAQGRKILGEDCQPSPPSSGSASRWSQK